MLIKLLKANKIILIFSFFVVFLALLTVPASPFNARGSSPDAIAIRVIPNPSHYSAQRWYSQQGFTGSPQSLTVDGYEAVRDGRTVYVNVANIASDQLFTNIYLISYNQEAELTTIDIFGQILNHWKFNTNITDTGYCSQTTATACLADADCPANEYCTSEKSNIIRDTKRLADLAEIKLLLEGYKETHGHYPILASGTYLPYITVSTWPSWQEVLAQELATTLPVDPINKLGDCPGYDEITCWNQETKKFADPTPDDADFNLPAGSQAYFYHVEPDGSANSFKINPEAPIYIEEEEIEYTGETENSPPVITGINLPTAYSGEAYAGAYLEASDPDAGPDDPDLTWTINTSAATWSLWSAAPTLEDTEITDQKAILADAAGVAGDYGFFISIEDGRGGLLNKNYTINVVNSNLPVVQTIADQTVTIGNNLSLTILASETDSQYPLTFEPVGLPSGLSGSLSDNQHDYDLSGAVIDETKVYSVAIKAADYYRGISAPKNFTITVENQPPAISSTAVTNATACIDYSYDVDAADPDSHSMAYRDFTNSLPDNLVINSSSGEITGQPQAPGSYNITITAQDQYHSQTFAPYSAEGQQNYTLNVADEIFTVDHSPSGDATIYVYPDGVDLANIHYFPITYMGSASVTTSNSVAYSISAPAWWLSINSNSGEIQGTPMDNINDPGDYNITVSATNNCGASHSTSFTITVLANEWCGDSIVQAGHDEQCESGGSGTSATDQYECANCLWTGGWCGDGTVQSGYGEQCESGGSGTAETDQYECNNLCEWSGGWCGDNIINGSELCDGSDDCASHGFCGGTLACSSCANFDTSGCFACGSNAHCSGSSCACDFGYQDCDSNFVNGCEADTGAGYTCYNGSACLPTTCVAQGYTCGSLDDGCGTTLDCGSICPPGACDDITLNQSNASYECLAMSGDYVPAWDWDNTGPWKYHRDKGHYWGESLIYEAVLNANEAISVNCGLIDFTMSYAIAYGVDDRGDSSRWCTTYNDSGGGRSGTFEVALESPSGSRQSVFYEYYRPTGSTLKNRSDTIRVTDYFPTVEAGTYKLIGRVIRGGYDPVTCPESPGYIANPCWHENWHAFMWKKTSCDITGSGCRGKQCCSVCGISCGSCGSRACLGNCRCETGGGGATTPYLFTYANNQYFIENDVMNTFFQDSGMTIADIEDAYKFNQLGASYSEKDVYKLSLKPTVKDNKIKLQIRELEPEESNIDRVQLIKTVHNKDTVIFTEMSEDQSIFSGRYIKTEPISCIDEESISCLDEILHEDSKYIEKDKSSFITLKFKPNLSGDNYLYLNSWGKEFIPRVINSPFEQGHSGLNSLRLKIYKNGQWNRLGQDFHPRDIRTHVVRGGDYWQLPIEDNIDDNGILTLEIEWTDLHYIDMVSISNITEQPFKQEELQLIKATHSRDKDVLDDLLDKDYIYAHIVRGDSIDLVFEAGELEAAEDEIVDYFFISQGFYHGLRTYLYPDVDPTDSYIDEVNAYIKEYNEYVGEEAKGYIKRDEDIISQYVNEHNAYY